MERREDRKGRKPKKPKKTSMWFEVSYKGGAKEQRRHPVGGRHYELRLNAKVGNRKWTTLLADLDDTDRDILLHQFVRVQLERNSFTREELPGVSVNDLMERLPFARKLRQVHLKKD